MMDTWKIALRNAEKSRLTQLHTFSLFQMTENLEGVNVHVNTELSVTTTTKRSSHFWLFTVTSKVSIDDISLFIREETCFQSRG